MKFFVGICMISVFQFSFSIFGSSKTSNQNSWPITSDEERFNSGEITKKIIRKKDEINAINENLNMDRHVSSQEADRVISELEQEVYASPSAKPHSEAKHDTSKLETLVQRRKDLSRQLTEKETELKRLVIEKLSIAKKACIDAIGYRRGTKHCKTRAESIVAPSAETSQSAQLHNLEQIEYYSIFSKKAHELINRYKSCFIAALSTCKDHHVCDCTNALYAERDMIIFENKRPAADLRSH